MRVKPGDRYPNDYTVEELKDISESLEAAVTVPVNVQVEAEHRVYDLSEMKAILLKAGRIVLQECGCRRDHGNCDHPLETCLTVNGAAEESLKNNRYSPREVDLHQAIEALERSHRAGLVHMAYTMKGDDSPTVICSCCPCSCHTLGGLIRYGIHTQVLTSRYVAEDDESKCVQCGACVDRCSFLARSMVDGELVYDESKCFGCGLCVSTCPASAISLVERRGAA
ncbi:MAG TPA: 4Fe-4S binding protein [Candidatus Desulfaltia sp.]|nr:4Fe-4S binding protein [Candidatus Desulfaltia sp.]